MSLIIPDELYHQIENVELSGKRSFHETIIYLLKKAVDSEISPSKSINDRSKNYDFSDLVGRLEWQGDAVKVQRLLRDGKDSHPPLLRCNKTP